MRLNTLFKSQQLIFLVASLFFGLLTLWIFGDLASPILISIVLAVLFRPVNTYFTKIGIPRKISVFITFLIVMFLIPMGLKLEHAFSYHSDSIECFHDQTQPYFQYFLLLVSGFI